MTRSKLLSTLAFAFTMAGIFAGCGKDEDLERKFSQLQIQPGMYASERCFMNKLETQAAGTNRYSLAQITFNADGTGSGHYTNFTDPTCMTMISDQTFTFNELGMSAIGGAVVVHFKQTGTVLNPTWWIPVNLSSTGYSMDVDFTDGESGPYIIEPSDADVASFVANPGQGVSFKQM